MSLDRLQPNPDAVAAYERAMAVPPAAARAAIEEVDLAADPVVRALFVLRGLPARRARLADLERAGFAVLVDDERCLVLGVRGRFWMPTGGLEPVDSLDDVPGTALALWGFEVEPTEHGCIVRTETRVRAADPRARMFFRLYWAGVGPFSGLIRRRMLALVERAARGDERDRPPRA